MLSILLSSFTLLSTAPEVGSTGDASPIADAVPSPSALVSSLIGFLPRGLTSFGAAVDNGWLYVLGGYFGDPHAYSIEGQSGAFMAINLHDTRDVRLLSDVEPVQGAELVPWRGQLVSVGGMHARNTADEPAQLVSSKRAALYDPLTGAWTELPPLPEPRSSHRAVLVGDRLHVLGGWSMSGSSKGAEWAKTSFVLNLDDHGSGWNSIETPFVSRALGAAAAGDHVCVVGGISEDRAVTSDVWILDTASAEWTQGPSFPDWGFGVSATSHGSAVMASGKTGEIFALRPGQASWESRGDLTHGRIFHELRSVSSDALVALGGIVGMGTHGRVRAIERLELSKAAAQSAVRIERSTIPAPSAARNRFGLVVEGRSAYLFGGNNSLSQHEFEPENFVSESWRLDFGSLDWTPLMDLPVGRQTIQTSVAQDGLHAYAVGGFGHNGEDAVSQSTTWVYDFEFGDWTEGPPLAGSRSQFGLVQRGDALWAFGGLDYDPARAEGKAFDHRIDVLRWDGKSESFEATDVRLPEGRRAFAGAMLGHSYYMVGGMGDGFTPVTSSVAFDFDSQSWRPISSPARPRVGADLVAINGELFLVGGSSPRASGKGLESNPTVERYAPEADAWSTVVDDLGMEMKHARAFELDGDLHVLTLHRPGEARLELARVSFPSSGFQSSPSSKSH